MDKFFEFKRNAYGEIILTEETSDLYNAARTLVKLATASKKVPYSYDSIRFDRKGRANGSATHHEIFDINLAGTKTLICVRKTEGTKYGVRTTCKTYYIISKCGKGVNILEAPKQKAAKAAKQNTIPGTAIKVCIGKKQLRGQKVSVERKTYYKIVAKEKDFISVYDKSPWKIGVTRKEGSTKDHSGGFYVFETIEKAIEAWSARIAFKNEWLRHERYSLLKCECSGRPFVHDNGKICITAVRPIAEIASFIL